jgi:hypothetical protein
MFIKARVCTRIDDETICTTREKKIVLAVIEDTKGNLLDGREVVKIDKWWYYIPPRGEITTPWEHENREPKEPKPPEVKEKKLPSSGTIRMG